MLESFGVPLPGETALITFGVLASQGHYDIRGVIAVATGGAIVGDNLGYWLIGRLGGRALLARWRWPTQVQRPRAPARRGADGPPRRTTVFFGRFVSVLRTTVTWIAGLSRMNWWKFLFWNAAGGIVWAATVALTAYYPGHATATAVQRYDLCAGLLVAGGIVALGRVLHRQGDTGRI
jgi:membrane protein DedA with SNARE-associated domain